MSIIGQRIKYVCVSQNLTLKQVCEMSDLKYGTLHSQIANNRPIPFSSVDAIASALQIDLAHFSARRPIYHIEGGDFHDEIQKHRLKRSVVATAYHNGLVSCDQLLDWLDKEDFQIHESGAFKDRYDLFHPAKKGDDIIIPHRIGKKSLAKLFFELSDEDDYMTKFSSFPQEVKNKVINEHVSLNNEKRFSVDHVSLSVEIRNQTVSGKYRRVMARVTDNDGIPFTLVYAQLIRAFSPLYSDDNLRGTTS